MAATACITKYRWLNHIC